MSKVEKLGIVGAILFMICVTFIVTIAIKNDFYAREKCYRAGYSNSKYLGGENKTVLCSDWEVVN